jgi:hypothetical protein
MATGAKCLTNKDICENEAISLDDLAYPDVDWMPEVRRSTHEGMEFSIFPTGIDSWRQIRQELRVEIAAGELFRERLWIDAGDFGSETGSDHGSGQIRSWNFPDGEQGLNPGPGQLFLAVGADVGQKKIAKSHGFNAFVHRAATQIAHARFILFVGTGPGKRNGPKRHTDGFGLQLNQLPAHGVHGHSIKLFVQGGDQRYNFNLRVLTQQVQRPGAILAARPGKRYPPLFSHVTISIG